MLTFDELWELLTTEDEGVEIEAKKAQRLVKVAGKLLAHFLMNPV
ncbi:MAG: hypothetical protein ACYT04_42250 [Nostoc sp.]